MNATCIVNGKIVDCGSWFSVLGTGLWVLMLLLGILTLVAMCKLFVKAGKQWWEAIIPIYNVVIMLNIAGKPGWWVILMFIPFLNFIMGIVVTYYLAKSFGKGFGFTIGLLVFPFIFYPILAFGSSQYQRAVPTI